MLKLAPLRAVDARNGAVEALNASMEGRDTRNGYMEGQSGAMEGRKRSQWRRGGLKWSYRGP
jgi:hypothetical protein